MGHKKLIRFAEISRFPNVLQHPENMAGHWHNHFQNNHPINLELACGKGEYAIGLGTMFPQENFIGVDIKGNRIWVGAKKALENKLVNVAFLRTQIDHISNYFAPGEVASIWITFPDPQLRKSKAKKRLTHPKFLRLYQQILQPDGLIHVKTDSPDLYSFTKTVIDLLGCQLHIDIENINTQKNVAATLKIKTHYESLDIAASNRIHYLCFSLPSIIGGTEVDIALKKLLAEHG
ncbi:MAG: tRNA (guanosine(46)-N7)-methyltransferase TrmB [Chitinophagaceae bacterium]|nr:tRNA (guanosine(46)-N7)-methyltransferase TrmB [Chitinophagaceae bacterium]